MKIHTIQLNIESFLGGTNHMDAVELGAYMSLLVACYQSNNNIPSDEKRLARMARVSLKVWRRIAPVIGEKFTQSEQRWSHERVRKEIVRYSTLSSKNKANALKSKQTTKPVATVSHSQTTANTSNKEQVTSNRKKGPPVVPPGGSKEFEEMWVQYPRQRRGGKSKAYREYNKALNRASIEDIYSGVLSYAASDEVGRGYAKGCAAWLNDDRWANDYSIQTGKPKEPTTLELRDEILAEMNGERLCLTKIN